MQAWMFFVLLSSLVSVIESVDHGLLQKRIVTVTARSTTTLTTFCGAGGLLKRYTAPATTQEINVATRATIDAAPTTVGAAVGFDLTRYVSSSLGDTCLTSALQLPNLFKRAGATTTIYPTAKTIKCTVDIQNFTLRVSAKDTAQNALFLYLGDSERTVSTYVKNIGFATRLNLDGAGGVYLPSRPGRHYRANARISPSGSPLFFDRGMVAGTRDPLSCTIITGVLTCPLSQNMKIVGSQFYVAGKTVGFVGTAPDDKPPTGARLVDLVPYAVNGLLTPADGNPVGP